MDEDTQKALLLAFIAAIGTFTVTMISLQIQKASLEKKYRAKYAKRGQT